MTIKKIYNIQLSKFSLFRKFYTISIEKKNMLAVKFKHSLISSIEPDFSSHRQELIFEFQKSQLLISKISNI